MDFRGVHRCCACVFALVHVGGALAAQTPFQLVSTRDTAQPAPAGGSGDSWGPVLSPDGRFVLFASAANNLTLTSQSNALPVGLSPRLNVYLRDRASGSTTLVSMNAAGTGGGNGDSIPTAISTNGRYACFESAASDLISDDTNGLTDVFVRDMASNTTYLVSIALGGASGNGACRGSTMTPDGRYVAFVSTATNLVAGDTNGIADVFLRDLQAGTTALASVGALSTNAYDVSSSEAPDISVDGRYVSFYSSATNLGSGTSNGTEIYVRDITGGTTIWASTNARTLLGTSVAYSYNQATSADGKFIAFETSSNAPTTAGNHGLILRYSVDTGLTDLVNTNAYIPTSAAEDVRSLEISTDGRFITFVGNTNVSAVSTPAVFLWDAQSGATTLASGDLNSNVQGGSVSAWPTLDPSGTYVAFLSSATNMVSNTVSGDYHLYLRNLQAGTTVLVDADTNALGTSVDPATAPRLSADGRLVLFESLDASLVANDRNHAYDVFLRDVVAGTSDLISARNSILPSATPNGPSLVIAGSLSSNGRYVAFGSDADNLIANDTNGVRDVFVRDLRWGTNLLVSVSTNGLPGDGISFDPVISGDGRFVAFTSSADNLVAGDGNKQQDVFVRDVQAGTTTLVSRNAAGTGSGNVASYSPSISSDGRWVLFRSLATDLVALPFSHPENLFVRDLFTSTTYALTQSGVTASASTPDGRFVAFGRPTGNLYLWDAFSSTTISTNASASNQYLAISPDGNHIAFGVSTGFYALDRVAGTTRQIGPALSGSHSTARFSADGRFLAYAQPLSNTNQVYVYDFVSGTNVLISQGSGLGTPTGVSDSPDISADGRFVAYRSFATNIVPIADNNLLPDLFLYDQWSSATTLLTRSRYGATTGDNRAATPVFSPDGRTLVFNAQASDLVPYDFNQSGDVLALSLFYAAISPGGPGQGPTLKWPARPGENYQVLYKNNLEDATWQPATGSVTITGNQAQLTDLVPAAGHRFYRIVAN
jgi:Tol biopolymer transport system component